MGNTVHLEAALDEATGKVTGNNEFVLYALPRPVGDKIPETIGSYHRYIGLTFPLERERRGY